MPLAGVPLILTLAPLVLAPSSLRAAQEDRASKIEEGRRLYQVHCQACHGKAGRGDGPMAGQMEMAPPDLTAIRRRNDGDFPAEALHAVIDGRRQVSAHGQRRMPVWGFTFQSLEEDSNQEAEVRQRITSLVIFLETLQQSSN